ncbi:helix-turn-helix domain-containing protein [Nocardiopsis sp. NPDC006198]|uniref:helix-turn-helix domain-containing protein n=1 Tax=Nocardiopsis sp. NPDC006198 TaxID=3154472 RepID=UPI0033B66A49
MDDNALGEFLRARREALPPDRVGLPAGPRRRTPGLRRAELATLSGVSVDYLTRLEQGRDRNPSGQVLVALADALRLSVGDRVQLRNLSKAASGVGALCPQQPPEREVRPTMVSLLERLEPAPAVLFNRVGETLAHTAAYARLAGPVGLLDEDGEPVNRWWFVFADDRARQVYPDWDGVADERIAELRAESALDDPFLSHLVEELEIVGGAPFTDRLAAAPAVPRRTGLERLVHPEAGELRLSYESLDAGGQRLVVYLPADEGTAAALDRLTLRGPVPLRAVSG